MLSVYIPLYGLRLSEYHFQWSIQRDIHLSISQELYEYVIISYKEYLFTRRTQKNVAAKKCYKLHYMETSYFCQHLKVIGNGFLIRQPDNRNIISCNLANALNKEIYSM